MQHEHLMTSNYLAVVKKNTEKLLEELLKVSQTKHGSDKTHGGFG